jgi:DNA-directed RNA polymerase specialized sigma24 family protein
MNLEEITTRPRTTTRRPDPTRDGRRVSFARQHGPAMLAGARRLVASEAMAIEVVEDAMDLAWSMLPLFRPSPMMMATWLQGLVVGCAVARLRAASRSADEPAERREGMDAAEAPAPSDGERPGPAGHASDLPTAMRAVWILIESEGLAPEDAARLLGIEPHAVWARLRRARRALELSPAEAVAR